MESCLNVQDAYPLTPTQAGMLFNQISEPGALVDIVQVWMSHTERFDAAAFAAAWRQLINRHPILRTRFVWPEGARAPVQEVMPEGPLDLTQLSLDGSSAEDQERAFKALLHAHLAPAFDLAKLPLFRVAIIQDKQVDRLIWTFHHSILDGRSALMVFREMFAIYEGLRSGSSAELAPLPSFREHVARLEALDQSSAEAHWRRVLQGVRGATPLPVARTSWKPKISRGQIRSESVFVPVEISSRIQERAREASLTLNTLVQGAWALLLARYSGESDICFGTARAGRRNADPTVGMFVCTLPMRIKVDPSARLLAWLRQIRQQQVSVRKFEHAPLAMLHAWSGLPRGVPLFDSVLEFENEPFAARIRAWGGPWKERSVFHRSVTTFPLAILVSGGERIEVQLDYDDEAYDRSTILCMLDHYCTLLQNIATAEDVCVGDVQMLNEVERQRVLIEWNRTIKAYDSRLTLQQMLQGHAERTGHAIAVEQGDRRVSYGDLNHAANRLAHILKEHGIERGQVVCALLPGSIELVTAFVAIQKLGAVYLPLDPSYPSERIDFILGDARAAVVITNALAVAKLRSYNGRVINVDEPSLSVDGGCMQGALVESTPSDGAYVIYTSGSTGRPRGVLVEQEALRNHCLDVQARYALERSDRVLQFVSPSFDPSIEQIMTTLISGATLVLKGAASWSATEFLDELVKQKITVVALPTAFWLEVARAARAMGARYSHHSLRLVVVGGEAMPTAGAALWREGPFASTRLLNMYGPTEATIAATEFEVPFETSVLQRATVPIGRPLANRRIYIVDDSDRPVPVGVAGELHIGGVGLARGYLNQAELTARKFVADPFADLPSGRRYRTGDIARYLPDGNVEFVGRMDDQVKVRGFRIELGEIEAALSSHPTVSQVAIAVEQRDQLAPILVAYVVPVEAGELQTGVLRNHLQERLPEFMIPQAFVRRAALPMTPNGKVDRKHLKLPQDFAEVEQEQYVAPRTETEQTLANIWCEVLGVARVGMNDNFFDLGGHSLLAVQIASRITSTFNVELPLKTLFEAQTIALLTEHIDRMRVATPIARPSVNRPIARQARTLVSRQVQKQASGNDRDG